MLAESRMIVTQELFGNSGGLLRVVQGSHHLPQHVEALLETTSTGRDHLLGRLQLTECEVIPSRKGKIIRAIQY